jgi:hypothetical protein
MLDSPDLVDQRDPSSLGDKKFLQNSLVLGLSLGPNKSLMNSTFNGEVSITVVKEHLPPCVVLVINDNPYGLMFASSYICRTCP